MRSHLYKTCRKNNKIKKIYDQLQKLKLNFEEIILKSF